jgi:hypothetical protein
MSLQVRSCQYVMHSHIAQPHGSDSPGEYMLTGASPNNDGIERMIDKDGRELHELRCGEWGTEVEQSVCLGQSHLPLPPPNSGSSGKLPPYDYCYPQLDTFPQLLNRPSRRYDNILCASEVKAMCAHGSCGLLALLHSSIGLSALSTTH